MPSSHSLALAHGEVPVEIGHLSLGGAGLDLLAPLGGLPLVDHGLLAVLGLSEGLHDSLRAGVETDVQAEISQLKLVEVDHLAGHTVELCGAIHESLRTRAK